MLGDQLDVPEVRPPPPPARAWGGGDLSLEGGKQETRNLRHGAPAARTARSVWGPVPGSICQPLWYKSARGAGFRGQTEVPEGGVGRALSRALLLSISTQDEQLEVTSRAETTVKCSKTIRW